MKKSVFLCLSVVFAVFAAKAEKFACVIGKTDSKLNLKYTVTMGDQTTSITSFTKDTAKKFSWAFYAYDDTTTYQAAGRTSAGYRFLGWYTMPANDTTRENTSYNDCTVLLTDNRTISATDIARGKKSAYLYHSGSLKDNVLAMKYQKVMTVNTKVSPANKGTVSLSTADTRYAKDGYVAVGKEVRLTAVPAAGYSFRKWVDDQKHSSYDNPCVFDAPNTTNVTYTAYFTGNVYRVTLSENGGMVAAQYAKAMPELAKIPEKSGYTFAGYYSGYDGTGTRYYNADGTSARTWNLVGDQTLYPKWTTNSYPLELVFSVGISNICYRIGSNETWYEVSSDTTVQVPYGTWWYACANPLPDYKTTTSKTSPFSEQMTTLGGRFAPTATLDGYLLTVDPNGGTYAGSHELITVPGLLKFNTANLNAIGIATKVDKILDGYYRNGVKVYDALGHAVKGYYWSESYPDGVFIGNTDITVTARWGDVVYDVTFVDPSGKNADVVIPVVKDCAATPPEWTRLGYTLSWDADFSDITEPLTVNAIWTPIPSIVRFDANGGEGSMDDLAVSYDEAFALPANTFTKGILTFQHWTTTVDVVEGKSVRTVVTNLADQAVVSNLTATSNATNVLGAVWGEDYLVAFDGNGATSGTMAHQHFTRGTAQPLEANQFARTGYRFLGWDDLQAAPTVRYTNQAEVVNLAPIGCTNTLVAAWSNNPYRVTFDLSGIDVTGTPPADRSCRYDEEWNLPAAQTPVQSEYVFVGWTYSKEGVAETNDASVVVSNLTATADATVAVKAVWRKDFGEYSYALGGEALTLKFIADDDTDWYTGSDGEGAFVGKHKFAAGAHLTAAVVKSGALTFKWKVDTDSGLVVYFYSDDEEPVKLLDCYQGPTEWKTETFNLEADPRTDVFRKIRFETDASDSAPIKIAGMTWTPVETHPEPTEADKVTVSAAAIADGRFSLSFTGDDAFDYRVLTNADLTVGTGWAPMGERKSGAAEMSFGPFAIDGVPQLFFKVETLQKQD